MRKTHRDYLVSQITSILLILSAPFLLDCQVEVESQRVEILIDNSGSIPRGVFSQIKERVRADAVDWVRTANPREQLTIWFLTEEGNAYPADHRAWTLPRLRAPANKHRQRFAERLLQELDVLFTDLPNNVSRTRLLESIYYIASTQDSPDWHLRVLSDLREDSVRWDALRAEVANDEAGLVTAMLSLCPEVKHPPRTASLVTWPGLISGKVDLHQHSEDRKLFSYFLSKWAPEASLEIKHLN